MSEEGVIIALVAASYLALQGAVCVSRVRDIRSIRRRLPPEEQANIIGRYDAERRRGLGLFTYLFNFPGRSMAYLIDSATNHY